MGKENDMATNALRSGLDAESQFVLGESREEFAQFPAEWYDHHAPANHGASPLWGGWPEERLQVDNLIRSGPAPSSCASSAASPSPKRPPRSQSRTRPP